MSPESVVVSNIPSSSLRTDVTFTVMYSAPNSRECSSNFFASSQPRIDFSPIQSSSFSVLSSSPPGTPRSRTAVFSIERPV